MIYLYDLGMILAGYLMGSIPTGYWIVLACKGVDIRTVGSGSTGATNVLRAAGKGPALFVFFFDIFKGYLPVAIAMMLEDKLWVTNPINPACMIPSVVAMAAIFGHGKSVFLKFKGGKSAATTLGALIGLNPIVAGLTFGTWLLVLFTSKIVSLASIIAAIGCPIYMFGCHAPISICVFSVIAAIWVVARHKDNMKRMLQGKEPKIGQKVAAAANDNKSYEVQQDSAAGQESGQDRALSGNDPKKSDKP